jgi:hypothetical protein
LNEETRILFYLILNIILATSALCAVIIALFTLRQAQKSRREERESRRSFLAPGDMQGTFRITDPLDDEYPLPLFFKNYGLNPVENIESTVFGINNVDVESRNDNVEPIFRLNFYAKNPIPHLADWTIRISNQRFSNIGLDDLHIVMTNYLIMAVKYYNRVLDKYFDNIFFLFVDEVGKFSEVVEDHINYLENLARRLIAT